MTVDVPALAELARVWAEEAAGALMSARDGNREVDTKSSATDVVTDMDRAAERLLVERISYERPGDAILGEEGSARLGDTGVRWVIDPLDGTVNYLYGLPNWSVSVGVEIGGVAVAGAVVAPVLGDTYVAWTGGGSWRVRSGVRSRIHASAADDLSVSLIGTGFSYDPGIRRQQGVVVAHLLPLVRDIRRAGSAAIDLCAVASGALDGYAERELNPWDMCAGSVIAREAGALVTGLRGQQPGRDYVVAAAQGIHGDLISVLESVDAS